jgi:hypothetical protein
MQEIAAPCLPLFCLFIASSCGLFWFGDLTFWPLQELAELTFTLLFCPRPSLCKNLQTRLVDSKLDLQIVDYLVVPLSVLRFGIVNGIFK